MRCLPQCPEEKAELGCWANWEVGAVGEPKATSHSVLKTSYIHAFICPLHITKHITSISLLKLLLLTTLYSSQAFISTLDPFQDVLLECWATDRCCSILWTLAVPFRFPWWLSPFLDSAKSRISLPMSPPLSTAHVGISFPSKMMFLICNIPHGLASSLTKYNI